MLTRATNILFNRNLGQITNWCNWCNWLFSLRRPPDLQRQHASNDCDTTRHHKGQHIIADCIAGHTAKPGGRCCANLMGKEHPAKHRSDITASE